MSEEKEKERFKGVVKFFSGTWGFIITKIGNEEVDIFVHYKDIVAKEGEKKYLEQGKRVEFEIGEDPKGKKARKVKRLESE